MGMDATQTEISITALVDLTAMDVIQTEALITAMVALTAMERTLMVASTEITGMVDLMGMDVMKTLKEPPLFQIFHTPPLAS